MFTVPDLGEHIALQRRAQGLTQATLARQARIGHSTLDALENGRLGELGVTKIMRLLSVLGLELRIQKASGRRPTLDELRQENDDDECHSRRG